MLESLNSQDGPEGYLGGPRRFNRMVEFRWSINLKMSQKKKVLRCNDMFSHFNQLR